MTKLQTMRWLEVRFFYILQDLLQVHDAMGLISNLAPFGGYSATKLQSAAMELLQSDWMHPARDEIIVLSHIKGYSRRRILKHLPVCNAVYYNILERKDLASGIMPRLDPSVHPHLEQFINSIDKIGGLGL